MSGQSTWASGPSGFANRFFAGVARAATHVGEHAGQLGLLVWHIGVSCVRLRVPRRDIMRQLYSIGIQSILIVLVAAGLIGIVTSQQGGYQMQSQLPLYVMGSIVVESVILEMGPVLTAIVMIGRIGARITAELGTMKVSEQIDALYSVGRDPVEILAAPRVLAMIISMPLLVSMANLVGITTGMISAQYTLGLGSETFFYGARLFWHSYDMFYSLMKALVFGAAIPLIAVHMGLRTTGGAEGVGRTTTHSVVFMTLTIGRLSSIGTYSRRSTSRCSRVSRSRLRMARWSLCSVLLEQGRACSSRRRSPSSHRTGETLPCAASPSTSGAVT